MDVQILRQVRMNYNSLNPTLSIDLFREGTDAIEFRSLKRIITWSLAYINKTGMKDLNTKIINEILDAFDSSLYEENDMFVSEEEFLFDFLNNSKIKSALRCVF